MVKAKKTSNHKTTPLGESIVRGLEEGLVHVRGEIRLRTRKIRAPEHPGKLLKEEMDARGLSIQKLARALSVPATRIHAIVHGRRGITADTSARLGRYMGVSNGYWLRLQGDYDMRVIDSAMIEREVLPEAS